MNIKYFVYFNTYLKLNVYAILDSFVIFLTVETFEILQLIKYNCKNISLRIRIVYAI